MNKALHYYLLFSLAVFIGAAVMMLFEVIHAPFNGFQFCAMTNFFGEGIPEMVVSIVAIPGILIILWSVGRRIWTKENWL